MNKSVDNAANVRKQYANSNVITLLFFGQSCNKQRDNKPLVPVFSEGEALLCWLPIWEALRGVQEKFYKYNPKNHKHQISTHITKKKKKKLSKSQQ